MTGYTLPNHRCQIPLDGCEQPIPITDLADELPDSPLWQKVMPEKMERRLTRNAIIHAYLTGACGATEAYNALCSYDLFGDIVSFMDAYCRGIHATSRKRRVSA